MPSVEKIIEKMKRQPNGIRPEEAEKVLKAYGYEPVRQGRGKTMEVKDYMKLPYTRLVQEMNDESGHYFYGRILELDGCQSTGDTLDELYVNLNEAMEGYIEVKLEHGLAIPAPERTENYSGKFNVRLPKSLHQRLAIEADKEGVSLNQLVLYKLAQ